VAEQKRWKLIPGEKPTHEYPTDADGIEERLADLDRNAAEQESEFWRVVSYINSDTGRRALAGKLRAAGWEWHETGWRKDGLPLLSEAGFHADRDAYSLYELHVSIRAFARNQGNYAAFLAGLKYAEFLVYQRTKSTGVGRPSDKEAVGAAMLHAWKLWKANRTDTNREEPSAKDIFDYYNSVAAEYGAPKYSNPGTFGNRFSVWSTARRAE
jgi:hypothetical protein